MTDLKKLSLIALERGIQLMDKVNTVEGAATEMVAVYLATPGMLIKARKDAAQMDVLLDQAAELDGEEAAKLISDFFAQCMAYSNGILGSLPEITEEMKAKVQRMQNPAS